MTATTLTASQINRLAQTLTETTLGRAATPEKAARRFARLLAENIGADRAAAEIDAILGAGSLEMAEGALDAAVNSADAYEAASEAANAEAPSQDDPAPIAHGTATFETDEAPAAEKPARKPRTPKAEAPADLDALRADMEAGRIQHTEKRLRALAEAGIMPPAPDFSADTHKRFRGKLAKAIEAVEAGDLDALRAMEINPISSSPKAIARYRDAAILAIEIRCKAERAAA